MKYVLEIYFDVFFPYSIYKFDIRHLLPETDSSELTIHHDFS
jgi:hypothetical protein